MAPPLYRPDPWLSQVLGCPCHSVPSPEDFRWTSRDSVPPPGFQYAKISVDAPETCGYFEAAGFRLIDTNLTFEAPTDQLRLPVGSAQVFQASPSDEAGVRLLASRCFSKSRFHLDPDFDRETADRVKAEWAGNYFSGVRGTHMIVAKDRENSVIGFLQLLCANDQMVIDLIGVDQGQRSRGIGQAMLSLACQVCSSASVTVGTQAANPRSVRFYENVGFRFRSASYVFHRHAT